MSAWAACDGRKELCLNSWKVLCKTTRRDILGDKTCHVMLQKGKDNPVWPTKDIPLDQSSVLPTGSDYPDHRKCLT